MEKKRTALYFTKETREELERQCKEIGMDMSNYVTHLIMQQKERKEKERQAKELINNSMEMMQKLFSNPNFTPEMMTELLQNKKHE